MTQSIEAKSKSQKQVWKIGNKTVVILDPEIVSKMDIDETNTFLEQELVDGGILMRIHRMGSEK